MSHPTQRMTTQFSLPPNTDEQLQEMLTLYKSPATIRDMKQVFFYTQATAGLTQRRVEWTLYGLNAYDQSDGGGIIIGANYELKPYYGLIGTTRTLNIADKINDLIDIRVPKDKYVVEINLVEATIEADPSNWVSLPDRALVVNPAATATDNPISEALLYEFATKLGAISTIGGTTPAISKQDYIEDLVNQSLRQSQPQTLYVRIKELSNGEPYNWAVTNSGQFSQDKSHQLHIRHGDVNYANLTLEFGHMAFEGNDLDYEREVGVKANGVQGVNKQPAFDKNTYRQYSYIDYNTQRHNPYTAQAGAAQPDTDFVAPYKGNFRRELETSFDSVSVNNFTINRQILEQDVRSFESTANRYAWQQLLIPLKAGGERVLWNFSGKPYLFNQQASRINFRFLVRLIHLF